MTQLYNVFISKPKGSEVWLWWDFDQNIALAISLFLLFLL